MEDKLQMSLSYVLFLKQWHSINHTEEYSQTKQEVGNNNFNHISIATLSMEAKRRDTDCPWSAFTDVLFLWTVVHKCVDCSS